MALNTTITLEPPFGTTIQFVNPYSVELSLATLPQVKLSGLIQTTILRSDITVGIPGRDGEDGNIDNLNTAISSDPGNNLDLGSDEKLYVPDDIASDPLAYYILAKG